MDKAYLAADEEYLGLSVFYILLRYYLLRMKDIEHG